MGRRKWLLAHYPKDSKKGTLVLFYKISPRASKLENLKQEDATNHHITRRPGCPVDIIETSDYKVILWIIVTQTKAHPKKLIVNIIMPLESKRAHSGMLPCFGNNVKSINVMGKAGAVVENVVTSVADVF